MLNLLILFFALTLMAGLLYFEWKKGGWMLPINKGALSSLFVAAALIQTPSVPVYHALLVTGLILCLWGDVFLALPQKRMFLYGLVAFLLGHIFYILGFFFLSKVGWFTAIGALLGAGAGCWVYLFLRTHLGSMKVPVLLYIVVISTMLSGAWTVLGDGGRPLWGRLMVFTGALAFYLSDLFVARDRFLRKEFTNRLIGLPLYYCGQFLLAFSAGSI